jgi:hypothetical protein
MIEAFPAEVVIGVMVDRTYELLTDRVYAKYIDKDRDNERLAQAAYDGLMVTIDRLGLDRDAIHERARQRYVDSALYAQVSKLLGRAA